MTVAVEQDAPWTGSQWKIEAGGEFFKEQARSGDRASPGLLLAAQQRGNIFFHRGKATRLQEEYLPASVGNGP
jgi:hypothetical protein